MTVTYPVEVLEVARHLIDIARDAGVTIYNLELRPHGLPATIVVLVQDGETAVDAVAERLNLGPATNRLQNPENYSRRGAFHGCSILIYSWRTRGQVTR